MKSGEDLGDCRHFVVPRVVDDTAVNVPGAAAPTVNSLSLWSMLMRWILQTAGPFASFVRSVVGNPFAEEGSTTQSWPMPVPYPMWLRRSKNAVEGKRGYMRMCQQKCLNLVVLSLNWLHLGKPATAPSAVHLGGSLNKRQWSIVTRLRQQVAGLANAGDIGPAKMGRTAAKVECLDSVLETLHAEVREFLPSGYRSSWWLTAPEHSFSPLKQGSSREGGRVVGKLKAKTAVVAKKVETHRLSVPTEPPLFDPVGLFDDLHKSVFVDPVSLAIPEEEATDPLPRVRVHASRQQAFELLHFLDDRHRLILAPAEKIRSRRTCGLFALVKDEHKDRMIVDARCPNQVESTLTEWTSTLGAIETFVQIELSPSCNLLLSGTDLTDYYYCYKVTRERALRNALHFPLTPQQAASLRCFSDSMYKYETLYPCVSTLAMGDNQAVELGQCAHIKLGLISGAFTPSELLTTHGRAPRGPLACGIVIDDVLIAEQVPVGEGTTVTEGEIRMRKLFEEYAARGLEPHPRKTFYKQPTAELWGAWIDGEHGIVRGSPKRMVPLIYISSKIALLGYATVALLQAICGSWVSLLQVRRRMLCLVDLLYVAQQGREPDDIVELSNEAVNELWILCCLGPIAVTNLRAQSVEEVYLTDASEWGIAAVRAPASQVFVKELSRHSLARGTWSKLLSPWKLWLKSHGELPIDEELPEGVPLVSHPLWLQIAKSLPFQLWFKQGKACKHINILELEAILALERKLAWRRQDVRYALGSDSQVALACIVKGRSSSPHLNDALQRSLAVVLGDGVYGCYGYVPSLANVADDPTRGVPVREPVEQKPEWLEDALLGSFGRLDVWLQSLGFSPSRIAGTPFHQASEVDVERMRDELLGPLRKVQKPSRVAAFDQRRHFAGAGPVSPLEADKKVRRGQEEPDGQTKTENKRQKNGMKDDEEPKNKAVCFSLEQVAPPAVGSNTLERSQSDGRVVSGASAAPEQGLRFQQCLAPEQGSLDEVVEIAELAPEQGPMMHGAAQSAAPEQGLGARARRRQRKQVRENPLSPKLEKEAMELLRSMPTAQFIGPDGRRLQDGEVFPFQRCGFLDLYSGRAGVAKALAKKGRIWVLTFDFTHDPSENLLTAEVQALILKMLRAGCFLGAGAAPECASFSRAVTPAVRDRLHPEGKTYLTPNMEKKVAMGNLHAAFVLEVVLLCVALNLVYWVENPDGSFLWLLGPWLKAGVAVPEMSYRFDMCRFKTLWRKRTRIILNTDLRGVRELCKGFHSHVPLRGRNAALKQSWTRVAQVYPCGLCHKLAESLVRGCQLLSSTASSLARCGHDRIGEAKNPGPARRPGGVQRDPADLARAVLVEPQTQLLQKKLWEKFEDWLHSKLEANTIAQLFLCPSLAVSILRSYGCHLYSSGGSLYELRHTLVMVQQMHPSLRAVMSPAWEIVTRWEEVTPIRHRPPLPEILFRAMFAVAVKLGWQRWAATMLLAFEGIARIGEVLAARRRDLVMPCDLFDASYSAVFMRVRKPKSRRRGKGRVQHIKIDRPEVVRCLEFVFGDLDPFLPLFPLSSAVFRRRWESVLDYLRVPRMFRPTPASVRGGGAILAYKRGESIPSILWRMRLVAQATLESYLQELAAENTLSQLPESAKERIRSASQCYGVALKSLA